MAARATYRHLLRSARTAFHGDHSTLEAARSQIRDGFEQNAKLKLSDPKVSEHIKHAEDIASILLRNVVQGQKNGDAYSMFCGPAQEMARLTDEPPQDCGYTSIRSEATMIPSRYPVDKSSRSATRVARTNKWHMCRTLDSED